MARLQSGPEQPFPTVWDDAGREVLDHAPPFLALADSTFQGLLRIQGGKWASYGFPSLGAASGYAVVCPGSSLIKAAPPRPSILQALSMAACTALLPDASLSLYKVEADPDFLAFLRQHIDSLGEHEFPWSIMDLNEPGFQLYGTKDQLHFAPGSQLQAIGRIIGRSLYHMTVVQPSSELQGTARSAGRGTAPETPSFQHRALEVQLPLPLLLISLSSCAARGMLPPLPFTKRCWPLRPWSAPKLCVIS